MASAIHMCLFDLEKAFDSVEFAVLLDWLFLIGVNGKPGVSSGTGTNMGDVLCRMIGDHPLPSR